MSDLLIALGSVGGTYALVIGAVQVIRHLHLERDLDRVVEGSEQRFRSRHRAVPTESASPIRVESERVQEVTR